MRWPRRYCHLQTLMESVRQRYYIKNTYYLLRKRFSLRILNFVLFLQRCVRIYVVASNAGCPSSCPSSSRASSQTRRLLLSPARGQLRNTLRRSLVRSVYVRHEQLSRYHIWSVRRYEWSSEVSEEIWMV